MPTRTAVHTDKAPPPLPVYSQAIICNGMVYCSGQVGVDPATKQMNQGGVGDRAKQCLTNLEAVLTEAGSSMNNVVKVGVFLTSMDNFAAVNREYEKWFGELKPSRTCVAVHQLPMQTDVEIECIAHLGDTGDQAEKAVSSEKGGWGSKIPFVGGL